MLALALPAAIGLLVAYLAVAWLRRLLPRWGLLDRPGERSSHRVPTPRGGGLGIVLGVMAGLAAARLLSGWPLSATLQTVSWSELVWLLAAGLLVAMVGLLDDVRSQAIAVRLVVQAAGAGLLIAGVGGVEALRLPLVGEIDLGLASAPLTLLWMVAVTNIYNFMDGIDGLAAGQAAIACVFLALAALVVGNPMVALVSACLGASAAGFLVHNFPPARVFMGDVGSTFIGFSFAGLAVLGAQAGQSRISMYVTALLIAPFLFDGTLTLIRRVWRGERWYQPHRSHLYQRLVRAGYSHRQVSLVYYLLALGLGGLGLLEVATGQGATEAFLLLGLVPLVGLGAWVRRVESRARAEVARAVES